MGFSNGTPTATNEEDLAADFVKFFEEFQNAYGIKDFRIFLTGESYAGRYVPYISDAMLDKNDTQHFNLSGKTRFGRPTAASMELGHILTQSRNYDV